MDKALYIPTFFDPRYKNSAYRNMNKDDILYPICIVINSYEQTISTTTTTSSTTSITTFTITSTTSTTTSTTFTITSNPQVRYQLTKLSALETRNYFRNVFTSAHTQQLIINELDTYFNSNSPDDSVTLLEW